jgi:exodeoxyribonuclease VII large subunit
VQPLVLSPTDFIATTNQILETSYGFFYIEGEVSQFRVSKQKWVYFDIKDDYSKVSFFGSIYMLPGPIEDGMVVRVGGTAKMHPQYGFSITAQSIQPVGEGSIQKAFLLLKANLQKEGLFDLSRKRGLPEFPSKVALIASVESAAYADFIKITKARWPFVTIDVFDTLVQGENAASSLLEAINKANSSADLADVMVVTRGGGSADDLAAFNDERVVRAIAASRIPTLVAIGHEVDESLSELVADKRASTPSNAAEILLPDYQYEKQQVAGARQLIKNLTLSLSAVEKQKVLIMQNDMRKLLFNILDKQKQINNHYSELLSSYNPHNVLKRGYSIVKQNGTVVSSVKFLNSNYDIELTMQDGSVIINQSKE